MNNISLHDVFASEGIRPKSMAVGTQKIKCPQCQGQNGGHKYSDNPLSLTINDGNNAVWHCHHCDWTGHHHDKSSGIPLKPMTKKPYTVPVAKPDPENEQLLNFMKSRGISKATVEKYKLYQQGEW